MLLSSRQRRIRRSVRMSIASNGSHVRMQKARKEAHQEAQRRTNGAKREAHLAEAQLAFHREPRLRLRDQRLALSHTHAHERRRSQVPHPPHAGRVQRGARALLHRRDRVRPRALARQSHRLSRPKTREYPLGRLRAYSNIRSWARY